jgi:hypothetical protein
MLLQLLKKRKEKRKEKTTPFERELRKASTCSWRPGHPHGA